MNNSNLIKLPFFIFIILMFFSIDVRCVDIKNLTCEYRSNPLGIENINPRLSWQINDLLKQRGQKQTAYRVIVSTSLDKLKHDKGDLWDSGKILSDQSVNVLYAGKPFQSGMKCYWKVKVWDLNKKEGNWSDSSTFSIGLLKQDDWKGKWIYKEDDSKINHIWYRKTFKLKDPPKRATIYVGSFGYHELYVNGEKITNWKMNPASSYLKKRVLYMTYEITNKLKKGDNVIAIWHAAGWTRWKRIREYRNPPFTFIAQADINVNGKNICIPTDTSWKCKKSNSSYFGSWDILDFGGEVIDDRRKEDNWCTTNYNDSNWKRASVYKYSKLDAQKDESLNVSEDKHIDQNDLSNNGGELTAQLSSQLLESQVEYTTIKPVSVTKNIDGTYLIDMGKNYTGLFEMNMYNGKEGDSICFEISDRPEVKCNWGQKSVYIYGKNGKGRFENRFNLAGGRWITVYGLSYKPSLQDIIGYSITSDRKQISSFESSSELLNKIYRVNLDTYLANTIDGILVDCPHRERRGWGEVTVAAIYGDALPNFQSGAYMDQYFKYMRDAQLEDGRIRGIINEENRSFLMWQANSPLTIWETYRVYADKKMLIDNYESMTRWMDWLYRNSNYKNNGALITGKQGDRNFPGLGDWCTPRGNFWDSSNSPEAVHFNNCLYALMLENAYNISKELGKEEDANIYKLRLDVQRAATHKLTYDSATGKYGKGQQIDQAFALLSGITPKEDRQKVYDNLVQNVLYDFPYYDTGSSGQGAYTRYFIEKGERMDLIYKLLKDTHHPSYGYFIKQGVNVWPERWSAIGGSRIHTCYTGIGGYFVKGFGGIRIQKNECGMQHFMIKPYIPKDLTYINTSYESLYGKIIVNQNQVNGKLIYHIEVPTNTTAELYLQATNKNVVKESNVLAENSLGVKYEGSEKSDAVGNYVIYKVESGTYDFIVDDIPNVVITPSKYVGDDLAAISRVNVSSMFIESEKTPGFEGFKINDGDDKTSWKSFGNKNEYVELQWATPQTFNGVLINEVSKNINNCRLEYNNGGNWKVIYRSNQGLTDSPILFDNITTDKLRLYILDAKSNIQIPEFKVLKK